MTAPARFFFFFFFFEIHGLFIFFLIRPCTDIIHDELRRCLSRAAPCVHDSHVFFFFQGTLRRLIDTAERAIGLLTHRDLMDNNGSLDDSTILINGQDIETNGFRTSSNPGHDFKLRFNFDDQRYRRAGPHMHPQGLASEPDLHQKDTLSK